jgi:hypothetical protein
VVLFAVMDNGFLEWSENAYSGNRKQIVLIRRMH